MILGKRRKESIDQMLEDARKRYAALAADERLTQTATRGFEDRYYSALKTGLDIRRFLEAEAAALDELEVRKEQKPAETEPANEGDTDTEEEERESFLDRVTRELYRRIEAYPSAVLPAGASYDMEKLAGMLEQFGKDHWPSVERAARTAYPLSRPGAREALESMAREYCLPGLSPLPGCFNRYVLALHDGAESRVEQEEQRCLAAVARFLRDMKKEVYTLRSLARDGEAGEVLKNTESFLVSALDNFRMKSLGLF